MYERHRIHKRFRFCEVGCSSDCFFQRTAERKDTSKIVYQKFQFQLHVNSKNSITNWKRKIHQPVPTIITMWFSPRRDVSLCSTRKTRKLIFRVFNFVPVAKMARMHAKEIQEVNFLIFLLCMLNGSIKCFPFRSTNVF